MSEWKAKRFWKEANVAPAEGGWQVLLDARPVRTPAKVPLILPTQALAEALAAEWQAQEERIDPGSMPLTRTANSALDKVAVQRVEVAQAIQKFGQHRVGWGASPGRAGQTYSRSSRFDVAG